MCGIFGFYKEDWTKTEFNDLASLNVKRGNQGFGGLSISSEREVIFRYSVPYHQELDIPEGNLIMCHSLAPTGNSKRIHPFETDRFVLAHNGILLNHSNFPEWKLGPIDSQYLLGGIEYLVSEGLGITDAIKIVNEKLQGQRACWMWDKFDKVAYFWRVMSPIFYKSLVFSSSRFNGADLLDEGTIYSLNYQFHEFLICGKFNFYSPYAY